MHICSHVGGSAFLSTFPRFPNYIEHPDLKDSSHPMLYHTAASEIVGDLTSIYNLLDKEYHNFDSPGKTPSIVPVISL